MGGFFQDQQNFFAGAPRQRGFGFGAVATKFGRAALPVLKKYIWPAAKRIGADFARQIAPELGDIIEGKTTPKRAVKRAASRTARNQVAAVTKKRKIISSETNSRNSRSKKPKQDIFAKLK